MPSFVTQTDIQMSGPGILGSDVAGDAPRKSKRISLGAGFSLVDGVLTVTTDLSGYLPLAGGTLTGDLKFTDATYDIGKSGATRPRDGFFSRNLTVGGSSTLTGVVSSNLGFTTDTASGAFTVYASSAGFVFGSGWGALRAVSSLINGSGIHWTSAYNIGLVPGAGFGVQIVNSTNPQYMQIYGTRTSTSSLELLQMRGVASANFELGTMKGSAGGSARGLTIGCYANESATITPWLSFTSSGVATVNPGTLVINSGGTGLMTKQTNIWLDSYGTHSGISYRRSEGTEASPTAVASNSLLGFFATYGYHSGAAYHSTQGCAISFYATEAYTATAQGAKMLFGTTPNGTTTLATVLTLEDSGVSHFSKLVGQTATEITSTPSGTTQTITLNNGNHQTLALTSSTGDVTVTLTVPSKVASGTLIIKQHASTPRDITWAVSSGSIVWLGAEPAWSSDATNDVRIVSWRYNGSVMYLVATDVGA